ncbi:MAG: penicillin acylase family protein [Spirochaetes bacterium]|nr:penicillin acylase family protein [Spirochaetota bacterium]
MLIKKFFKITLISICCIIILFAVIFIAFKILKISYNKNEYAEVESPIIITRDNKGIPSVEVKSINDLYFTLGYLHAKDRLRSIEYLRSIATGESNNYAGEDAPFLNELSSTMGFTKNAENIAAKLNDKEILALKNYVNGINYFAKSKNKRKWIIEDLLAILSMKEWANSFLVNKELIFNLPISKIESKKIIKDNDYLFFYNRDEINHILTLRKIKDIVEKYMCSFARGNSVYLPSALTSIDSDSFTTLNYEDSINIYPGWYLVKIKIGDNNIFAITYHGLPFIFSFKNNYFTLTQLNINADSQNFYLFDIEYKDSIQRYKISGATKDYITVRNPVYNNNELSSKIDWITDKGPVLSNLIKSAKTDAKILVIESIQPGVEYVKLMLNIPFETEIDTARKRLLLNDSTLKGFIISDINRAFKIYAGFVNQPNKNDMIFIDGSKSLQPSPWKFSSVMSISGYDYIGSDLSMSRNTMNYNIINKFKDERFNSLVIKNKVYDKDKVISLISDSYSIVGEKFTPIFNKMLESNPMTSSKLSLIYLNNWNLFAESKLQAPAIFYRTLTCYINESYRNIFGEDSEYNLNNAHLLYFDFFNQLINNNPMIFDKPESKGETKEKKFDIAFLNSMKSLNRDKGPLMENWTWGSLNSFNYEIPSVRTNFLRRVFFKAQKLQSKGGPDTVENIQLNGSFDLLSTTSFQSVMTNETMWFKMNLGYSTSILSDFYFGSNIIDKFENPGSQKQTYKTTIAPE